MISRKSGREWRQAKAKAKNDGGNAINRNKERADIAISRHGISDGVKTRAQHQQQVMA